MKQAQILWLKRTLTLLPLMLLSACESSVENVSETANHSTGSATSRALVIQEPVTTESECADGLRIRWGNDDNDNSALENQEEVGSTLVCYSEDSKANHFQLTALSQTDSCTSGRGQQLLTGKKGANGALESKIQTFVICDSDDAATSTTMASQIERGKRLANNVKESYATFMSDSTQLAYRDYSKVLDEAFSSDEMLSLYHALGVTAIAGQMVLNDWNSLTSLSLSEVFSIQQKWEKDLVALFRANGFSVQVAPKVLVNPLTSSTFISAISVDAIPDNGTVAIHIFFPLTPDQNLDESTRYRINMASLEATVGNQTLSCPSCNLINPTGQNYIDLIYPPNEHNKLTGVNIHLDDFIISSTTGKELSAAIHLSADVQNAKYADVSVLDLRQVDITGTLKDEGKQTNLVLKATLPANGLGQLDQTSSNVLDRIYTAISTVTETPHTANLTRYSNLPGYTLSFPTTSYENAIEAELGSWQLDVQHTEKRVTIVQDVPTVSNVFRVTSSYYLNDALISTSVSSETFAGRDSEMDTWLKKQLIKRLNGSEHFSSEGAVRVRVELSFDETALNSVSLVEGATKEVQLDKTAAYSFAYVDSGLSEWAIQSLEAALSSNLSGQAEVGITVSDFRVAIGEDMKVGGDIEVRTSINGSTISALFSLTTKQYEGRDIGVAPNVFTLVFRDGTGGQMAVSDMVSNMKSAGWVRVDGNIVGRIIVSLNGTPEILFNDGSVVAFF